MYMEHVHIDIVPFAVVVVFCSSRVDENIPTPETLYYSKSPSICLIAVHITNAQIAVEAARKRSIACIALHLPNTVSIHEYTV